MSTGNVPATGEICIDHTGHFIADVEAARAALIAQGFTVTPRSAQVQPDPETGEVRLTGTGNICVMLREGYLEFLYQTADTAIGREFQAALDRRAGLHLIAFGLADAEGRHAALDNGVVPMRPLVHFSREIDTVDGSETAAFTVARLAAGTMPEGRVQFVTHHNEAALWQRRWLAHSNHAQSLRGIVISSPDPAETAARFARVVTRTAQPRDAGFRIALDRGAIDILPEADAEALTGQKVEPGRSAFVACRIGVSSLDGPLPDDRARIVPFGPALGKGAWIFEPM